VPAYEQDILSLTWEFVAVKPKKPCQSATCTEKDELSVQGIDKEAEVQAS